jgi:type I restriction enzyme S subunit
MSTTVLNSSFLCSGVEHSPPTKNSDLSWLGRVPAHWSAKRARFLVSQGRNSVKPGPFGTQLKTSEYVETGIKVFNQETIISGDFERGKNYITPDKFRELTEFEVQPGELLLTTRGTIGRCAIVPDHAARGIIHPCLMRIRLNPQLMINEYAVAFIEGTKLFLEQVNLLSNATTIEVVYSENFREVVFPVPPLEAQREIVDFVFEQTAKIDRLMALRRLQMELLREQWAALIQQAVTRGLDPNAPLKDSGLPWLGRSRSIGGWFRLAV